MDPCNVLVEQAVGAHRIDHLPPLIVTDGDRLDNHSLITWSDWGFQLQGLIVPQTDSRDSVSTIKCYPD